MTPTIILGTLITSQKSWIFRTNLFSDFRSNLSNDVPDQLLAARNARCIISSLISVCSSSLLVVCLPWFASGKLWDSF